ncbi:MAG TPA: FHA domain-containing protein [Gemmataceae bacterium]|jgi:pSer/pThr/pTyr-binding forkhead associated (FHA) protein|nr:FHA domain-containing protein [Gemmataceae bacterium]
MKLSLVVLTPGKTEGKEIPITVAQFTIGRDPKCNLRPASSIISKRHCALLVRNGKVFLKDFDSTNGTFVNDQRVAGERELNHQDKVGVGPLIFAVRIESSTPVDRPTPAPPTKAGAKTAEDEEAAALLLALNDADTPASGIASLDSQGVPAGSTVMEMAPLPEGGEKEDEKGDGGAGRMQKAVKSEANTSAAAKALLDKYIRRPRA